VRPTPAAGGGAAADIQLELFTKIGARGRSRPRRVAATPCDPATTPLPTFRHGQFDVICIGSSTGGPPVLETILPVLPVGITTPIVVAQHMPEIFTRSMAERLGRMCSYRVLHAADGMALESRTIYIAPGGRHTHIRRVRLARWQLAVNDEPAPALYKPGVDALLHSAAQATGARTLAVVLTGIGHDGLEGAQALHAAGGVILAQDAASCVVYGMPKAVTQAKLVSASLSPDQIAQALRTLAARPGHAAA
jgi:two-component system chemotaxis response regulator CheB